MIYPAIDLLDGKCVRLLKGDYNEKTVYEKDPLEMAKEYESYHLPWLHLIDLSGAKQGKLTIAGLIKSIKNETKLQLQIGGGLRSLTDMQSAIDAGADRLLLGSILFSSPDVVIEAIQKFGLEKISFSLDGKFIDGEFVLFHSAWESSSKISIDSFLQNWSGPVPKIIFVTDINKDGTLSGVNVELYKSLSLKFPKIIWAASGGVKDASCLEALKNNNIHHAIVGKAIYNGNISIKELAKYITC